MLKNLSVDSNSTALKTPETKFDLFVAKNKVPF